LQYLNLPSKRWVIRRKAEVVDAVRGGLLSLEEACKRYTLTVDEFLAWQNSIDRHGLAGLRTTASNSIGPIARIGTGSNPLPRSP
jgi:hypothetical protein